MFKEVKNHIINDALPTALELLGNLVEYQFPNFQNEVILLRAKLTSVIKSEIRGTDPDCLNEKQRLNYSLLQLVSLIEYQEGLQSQEDRVGYILIRYWSNEKRRIDFTINTSENENIFSLDQIIEDQTYIVKYSYGANLRTYLPPVQGYSNSTIDETPLIINLKQCSRITIIAPIYQFSSSDFWAKVRVL